MKNHKLWGVLCIFLPPIMLVVILAAYAMLSFVAAQSGSGYGSDSAVAVFGLMRIVMGLGGMVCCLGFLVGLPLGIYLLCKQEPLEGVYDKRSGKGEASTVPAEIKGWSWGAFMLNWIWGIANNVWLSLLCFVPFVNIVMIFVLGVKGKEWAWREKQWLSVEDFKRVQKVWDIIGLVLFLLNLVWIVLLIVMLSFMSVASWHVSQTNTYNNDWHHGMMGNYGDDIGGVGSDTTTTPVIEACTTLNGFTTGVGQQDDLILVAAPSDNQVLTSPVSIHGVARGNWFSEAVFPIKLVDADGNVLATGQGQATGDWMTTDFVPFTATLTYDTAPTTSCGTLILSNDNPSGDPAKDKSLEIPVNIE